MRYVHPGEELRTAVVVQGVDSAAAGPCVLDM
jgi:hypothetical protein